MERSKKPLSSLSKTTNTGFGFEKSVGGGSGGGGDSLDSKGSLSKTIAIGGGGGGGGKSDNFTSKPSSSSSSSRPKTADVSEDSSSLATGSSSFAYLTKGMFLSNILKLKKQEETLPEINPLKAVFANSFGGINLGNTKAKEAAARIKASKEAWPEEKDSITIIPVLGAPDDNNNSNSNGNTNGNSRGVGVGSTINKNSSKNKKYSQRVADELNNIKDKLDKEHIVLQSEASLTRLRFMQNADDIIQRLPLKYLYSKPELRRFALERISKPIINLAVLKAKILKKRAFAKFKLYENAPVNPSYNEKQVGMMILIKRFIWLYKRALAIKFMHWAMIYSSRFAAVQAAAPKFAAIAIQNWFRHIRIVSRDPWRKLANAIQTCLHRRKAIRYTIEFEKIRRSTVIKIKRGIAHRRRVHFAARMVQRVFRWVLLYSKTKFRLTRVRAARKIQQFVRMVHCRKEEELLLIKLALRMGGYSSVKNRLMRCPRQYQFGYLAGINACVSMLQKAWFTSKGSYAMFIKLAARKAKALHDKLLNDSATMIQNNYRGHLWFQLLKAAVQNNRARRISFSFRHYQYRTMVHPYRNARRENNWNLDAKQRYTKNSLMVHRSKLHHRQASKLQRFIRWFIFKTNLKARFKLRRYVIVFLRAKKQLSAIYIQRAQRAHSLREKIKREELRKLHEAQRGNALKARATISKIQRNWRQMLYFLFASDGLRPTPTGSRSWEQNKMFIRHAYLVMQRQYREEMRRPLHRGVSPIQSLIRRFLARRRIKNHKRRVKMANRIWGVAKSFLLKQAISDRIFATRIRKIKSASVIKRHARWMLWWRKVKVRFALRRARLAENRLRHFSANVIQRIVHRKYVEYFSAVRLAGRRQLAKRRIKEEQQRIWEIRDKATRVIVKFMRLFPVWNKNMKFVKIWRRYYTIKRLGPFCRMIYKWANYRRAIKEKEIAREKRRVFELQTKATGVIGYYYRRKKEGKTLQMRFVLRKQMLDVYKKLDADKKAAEELQRIAEEDKKRTDENLAATIAASWKQGSDPNGRNYYYNFVTGESQWNPPDNWNMKSADVWIRNIDDKGNVYYYNQVLGESQWLPPCVSCGEESTKWCTDCGTAYCDKDYDKNHGDDCDDSMRTHQWSAVEYEKDKLGPGEIYCMECKKRKSTRACTTCWDYYCDECFKRVHHVGVLKTHKSIPYKKAKAGWSCVKSKSAGESDYFVNGMTGEVTYDKPEELMNPTEKLFWDNFQNHKKASEEHIKSIEKLQLELESTIYERDSILYEAINGSGNIAGILKKRKNKKGGDGEDDGLTAAQTSTKVIEDVMEKEKSGGGWFEMLSPEKILYRTGLLKPAPRPRGKARSDYIKSLLDEDEPKK